LGKDGELINILLNIAKDTGRVVADPNALTDTKGGGVKV
jgi:hypothetical protein